MNEEREILAYAISSRHFTVSIVNVAIVNSIAFVVETFIENNDSVIAMQTNFRFTFHLTGVLPFQTVKPLCCGFQISKSQFTGTTLKYKPRFKPRIFQTAGNIQAVRDRSDCEKNSTCSWVCFFVFLVWVSIP